MAAETQKLKLFWAIPEEKLGKNWIANGVNQIVPAFSLLQGDLGILIEFMDRADSAGQKRQWWIARVECSPEQVATKPEGYQSMDPIGVPDGYVPREEALLYYRN